MAKNVKKIKEKEAVVVTTNVVETTKKVKRSVVKRAKIAAVKEAARKGPATAYLKNVPTSPRKMRLVVDLIRGERVSNALNILKYESQQAAARLEKLLLSAISNWESKNTDTKLEEADLFVKEIFVDGGRMLKRLRPAPQGRAHRVRKRSNHVTLVVDRMPAEVKVEKKATVKETKE
ncbi:MAG TPA: 50S ribosomal protein L22 [Cyclobacteriaceae bacterium]|jgi:large subunit ribosomal protein L22|nr:50S ribosomal protein L22 [Cyclobacteriaceae bacterium]